jgi:hypothetical protein
MHTTFATVGLSALLAQPATAFSVVKRRGRIPGLAGREDAVEQGELHVPRGAPAGLAKVFFQSVATVILRKYETRWVGLPCAP